MMRRLIRLLVTLVFGLLVVPLAAAQPQAALPRIGYLGDTPGPFAAAFRQGLRNLGYVEGQTIAIEYRWAEGKGDRLRDLAADLARLKLDVIVTAGTPASRAARHATSTIPIVMAHVGDPVGVELVASLARPGGNITGVSLMHPELSEKQLELLKGAMPQVSRLAVLWNSANPANALALQEIQGAALGVGVRVHAVDVQRFPDVESAFTAITTESAEALIVNQDPYFFSHLTQIVNLVAKSRLPAIYMYREWVDAGGLMAYGPGLVDVYRRV
jgi:putative ABC transport system substrate-binding protein